MELLFLIPVKMREESNPNLFDLMMMLLETSRNRLGKKTNVETTSNCCAVSLVSYRAAYHAADIPSHWGSLIERWFHIVYAFSHTVIEKHIWNKCLTWYHDTLSGIWFADDVWSNEEWRWNKWIEQIFLEFGLHTPKTGCLVGSVYDLSHDLSHDSPSLMS